MLPEVGPVRIEITLSIDQPSFLLFVREFGVPLMQHLERLPPRDAVSQIADFVETPMKVGKKTSRRKPGVRVSER